MSASPRSTISSTSLEWPERTVIMTRGCAAGRRQGRPALRPREEGHPQRLLQGLDARAHGGLGETERIGRLAKAAERFHGQKRLHLADFHDSHLARATAPLSPL